MSNIFISHSSKDRSAANKIITRLVANKHVSVFLDFDSENGIIAGTSWERTLYRKLRSCRAVIAVCTDNYASSQWCFAEIALARMEYKPIFVLVVDPLKNDNVPAILREFQAIDLRENEDEGYARLWMGLREAGLEQSIDRSWNSHHSPYPGLFSFKEKDAPIFFGREAEISEAVDLLRSARRENLLLILGASGSGKSSLVSAGILPRIRCNPDDWIIIGPFRPGQEPLKQMAASFAKIFGSSPAKIAQELAESNDLHKYIIEQRLNLETQNEATVLLIIDQFEELLGHSNEHHANNFLALLRAALVKESSELLVLATMRSDFLNSFQQNTSFQGVHFDKLSVGPIPVQKMRTVIEEPARLGQIELEAGLVNLLLNDTMTPDALPLLSFTLRILWDKFGQNGVFKIKDYESLGGLHGAIAKEAEAVLEKTLKRWSEQALSSMFLKMTRINDEGSYVRKIVRWDQLAANAYEMLKSFVDNRLLVSYDNDTVGVAHEALFRVWDRLAEWLNQAKADLLLHQQIKRAAEAWEQEENNGDSLWRGSRLARAIELLQNGIINVDLQEEKFIIASEKSENMQIDKKNRTADYTNIREKALRKYVHPYLQNRKVELEQEMNEVVKKNNKFTPAHIADLRSELNAVINFIYERGRWHAKEPVYVKNAGPDNDYVDVYQFPCCGIFVLGDGVGEDESYKFGPGLPSRFRDDGCEEPPIQ